MDIRQLTQEDCAQWGELLAAAFERPQPEMDALLGWMHAGYRMVAWGAWDGDTLAAQYSCLVMSLHMPDKCQPVRVGMSVNMATHPAYRGRGLIKHVARPVYDRLSAEGVVAGVGFSNAAGVKVDRNSKDYGYNVLGQLVPQIALVPVHHRSSASLQIWQQLPQIYDAQFCPSQPQISFNTSLASIIHRFAQHPFRKYRFGIWYEENRLNGVVVFRPIRGGGVSLMAAHVSEGYTLDELLRRWLNSLEGAHYVHFLATPNAGIRHALQKITTCLTLPHSRHPYYLTAKPLQTSTPAELFDFAQWDCVGGDIL